MIFNERVCYVARSIERREAKSSEMKEFQDGWKGIEKEEEILWKKEENWKNVKK